MLVVGVKKGQPDGVVRGALRFAQRLDARLVLATVDNTRYTVRHDPVGIVAAFSIDSDDPEVIEEVVDPKLADHVRELLEPSGVEWRLRALAGDPAHELATLADELDAVAIVVGTRNRGLRSGALEFFNGSVAVHLAHRQHHPIIVIPLDPAARDESLPWEAQAKTGQHSQHQQGQDGERAGLEVSAIHSADTGTYRPLDPAITTPEFLVLGVRP